MSKAKPVQVWLNRAEGPTRLCGEKTVRTFAEANTVLRDWARTAPSTGGYDKCDFRVDYDNGDTYSGRFDLVRDDQARSLMLETHIEEHCRFMIGERRPLHLSDEHYRAYLTSLPDAVAEYREFFSKCQIGDVA